MPVVFYVFYINLSFILLCLLSIVYSSLVNCVVLKCLTNKVDWILRRKTKFLKEMWFFILLSSTEKADNCQLLHGLKNIHATCKSCSDSRGARSRCGSPTWQLSLNMYAFDSSGRTSTVCLPCECLDIHNIFGSLVSFPWEVPWSEMVEACGV